MSGFFELEKEYHDWTRRSPHGGAQKKDGRINRPPPISYCCYLLPSEAELDSEPGFPDGPRLDQLVYRVLVELFEDVLAGGVIH